MIELKIVIDYFIAFKCTFKNYILFFSVLKWNQFVERENVKSVWNISLHILIHHWVLRDVNSREYHWNGVPKRANERIKQSKLFSDFHHISPYETIIQEIFHKDELDIKCDVLSQPWYCYKSLVKGIQLCISLEFTIIFTSANKTE